MNIKSRWFSFIIFEGEFGSNEALRRVSAAGAEVYRHGGSRPHWHCLVYTRVPQFLETMKSRLGRLGDDSFRVVTDPDATRRYMRNGVKV